MVRIRAFEDALAELFKRGELVGAVHLSTGQEAVAAGAAAHLRPGDQMTVTHRGHGHMIARGLDPARMLAEILGREDGYCKGKGGSMHVACLEKGIAGANGIVGAGIPIAFGLGVAASHHGQGDIAVAAFGDGAANQGVLYESLNLAALWSTPVVFLCENNQFTEFTPTEDIVAGPGIHSRAAGYGIPGERVDGDDAVAVAAAFKRAVHRARQGDGPSLIECVTHRWSPHHQGEESYAGVYRVSPEVADPISRLAARCAEAGVDVGSLDAMRAEEAATIAAAVEFAKNSPIPSLQSAYEDVYV
jgi:pyruvate dehydrogenase E1 component alpha subunit